VSPQAHDGEPTTGDERSDYRHGIATVLFVYAHPDDESFGIAGTAMKLAAAGHATALLTLTRGDVGMWFGKEHGSWTPAELAAERSREWRDAVTVIGFRHARLLEWPDGGLGTSPVERVTADVVELIREIKPDAVCTFGPEGAGSEHDDHRAASFFAVRGFHRAAIADQYPDRGSPHAARRLFFNASPFLPDLPFVAMTPTHTVDIRAFQDRKAKAFECHKTQFKDRDRFYQMLERRDGKEFFHLAIDRRAAAPEPGDLFA
jgi:LmbE family N-acetylglucosaminyl deacetylase